MTVLSMCILFVVVPIWIGMIWVKFFGIRDRVDAVCTAYLSGILTMFAIGQLVLVPLIPAGATLSTAVSVIKMCYTVAAVLAFYCLLTMQEMQTEKRKMGGFTIFFGILAALLILLQAVIPVIYQHIDDDDSRFVSEEVSAVVHDTMLKDDPITDDFMYWNIGETRKDLASPWTMYVASCCRIVRVAPAVFSHTMFPFFMILICYMVYMMLGRLLFSGDMEKVYLFLIFLSVLMIWDYTSTHTVGPMILLRIWQGKAIVAGFLIPVLLWIFYHILQDKDTGHYLTLLFVTSFAGSLFSGIGIVIVPVLLMIYGLVDFIYYRNFGRTIAVWFTAVPCGGYMAYYLLGLI